MNLILSYKHYAVSIARYFRRALETLGHNVWSAGSFHPTLPYAPHIDYASVLDIPNYEIPPDVNVWDAHDIVRECPFKPDLFLAIDAGFHPIFANQTGIKSGIILTDPHAFNASFSNHYTDAIGHYDAVFCMQKYLIQPYTEQHGAVWYLPYAASHLHHYWTGTNFDSRPYDLCMISGSLNHPKRMEALNALATLGLNMRLDTGLLYHDSTREYNNGVIAFNRSTEKDLPARFFEGLAQRNLVLTERLPDLEHFDMLHEDEHYVAYDSIEEMLDKAAWYATRRDLAWKIASEGYAAYWQQNHTYLQRVQTIFSCMGLG